MEVKTEQVFIKKDIVTSITLDFDEIVILKRLLDHSYGPSANTSDTFLFAKIMSLETNKRGAL